MSKKDLIYLENEWKQITTLGNELIDRENQQAVAKYETALNMAEKLMAHEQKCEKINIPVMPIFLISCNNLAEAYISLENWQPADKMLRRGFYYILFLKEREMENPPKEVLSKWIFKQLSLYKEFSEQSSQPEKYRELLGIAKTEMERA